MDIATKELIESALPILGTLAGAIIGATATVIVTLLARRADEKKHLRELCFKAGIENWKEAAQFARERGGKITSLDHYILHMKLFSENVIEKELSPQQLASALQDVQRLEKEYIAATPIESADDMK